MPVTLGALAYLSVHMGNPVLAGTLVLGVLLSAGCLLWKRKSLTSQRHHVLLALLASFSSIAVGFIFIFLLGFLGSIHALDFLDR